MQQVYLVKNISPWMMDELIVFARKTLFKLVLIRKPGDFYTKQLEELKQHGIDVIVLDGARHINSKKLFYCLKFIASHFSCFFSRYSFVIGVKSIWWFLCLDETVFEKPVSIHAQFATQPSILALILRKFHGNDTVKYFFTFHAYDIFFNNRWFRELVNNSEMCFSISTFNIEYVSKKYKGLAPSKIELCRLGTFPVALNGANARNNGLEFNVGFIGWFVKKKGLNYLVDAMKLISAENKNIRLTLAGDGPLRESIEKSIAENNLAGTVRYVGKLNFDEKRNFFKQIDVLVVPSVMLSTDMEGIPVVLMEAVANGVPVIATDISGIPEICINNYNGLLVAERSAKVLADGIKAIYNDRSKQQCFSENAKKVFEKYDIEINSFKKLRKLNWLVA